MSVPDITESARAERWRASREGAEFVCQRCWQGMRTYGSCIACGSSLITRVRTAPAPPIRAPMKPWLSYPLQAWLGEYRDRARLGKPQLVAKTPGQKALVEMETKRATPRSPLPSRVDNGRESSGANGRRGGRAARSRRA